MQLGWATYIVALSLTGAAEASSLILPREPLANAVPAPAPAPTPPENPNCAYLKCVRPTDVASSDRRSVSRFCESVLKTTPTTRTVTTTVQTIVVITPPVATVTSTETVTGPAPAPTTTTPKQTTTGAAGVKLRDRAYHALQAEQTTRAQFLRDEIDQVQDHSHPRRMEDIQAAQPIPSALVTSCKTRNPPTSVFSKPCSCFLTTATVTQTVTTTQTGTLRTSTTTVTKTVTVFAPLS